MDKTSKEGACGDDDLFGVVDIAKIGAHPCRLLPFGEDLFHHLLAYLQIWSVEYDGTHIDAVSIHIDLGTASPHGRPFGGVEDAKLDTCAIGGEPHLSAKGVDLFDQMPFGQTSDRWIAARSSDLLGQNGDHQRLHPHSGTGQGRFDTGVPATNYDHIIFHLLPL